MKTVESVLARCARFASSERSLGKRRLAVEQEAGLVQRICAEIGVGEDIGDVVGVGEDGVGQRSNVWVSGNPDNQRVGITHGRHSTPAFT